MSWRKSSTWGCSGRTVIPTPGISFHGGKAAPVKPSWPLSTPRLTRQMMSMSLGWGSGTAPLCSFPLPFGVRLPAQSTHPASSVQLRPWQSGYVLPIMDYKIHLLHSPSLSEWGLYFGLHLPSSCMFLHGFRTQQEECLIIGLPGTPEHITQGKLPEKAFR